MMTPMDELNETDKDVFELIHNHGSDIKDGGMSGTLITMTSDIPSELAISKQDGVEEGLTEVVITDPVKHGQKKGEKEGGKPSSQEQLAVEILAFDDITDELKEFKKDFITVPEGEDIMNSNDGMEKNTADESGEEDTSAQLTQKDEPSQVKGTVPFAKKLLNDYLLMDKLMHSNRGDILPIALDYDYLMNEDAETACEGTRTPGDSNLLIHWDKWDNIFNCSLMTICGAIIILFCLPILLFVY